MRIGIVNDMPLAVEVLRRVLSLRDDFRVVWVAADGREAIEFCAATRPDLVLMDLVMPNVDGVAATRQIMALAPCAILIVTGDIGANATRVYEAMGAGALDAVDLPQLGGGDLRKGGAGLLAKIDQIGRRLADRAPAAAPGASVAAAGPPGARLLAIGASAGGPAALATLLGELPADFAAATVIVQHVDESFAAGMADWLDKQSALPVRIARHGDAPVPGVVLLASTQDHLRLTSAGGLAYTVEPAGLPYRPSIDVFFQSVADFWPACAVGVLLTGMGRDGAAGLRAMRLRQHHTLAQDRETSAVYGMPKAAAELDAAVEILPLGRIAARLVEVFGAAGGDQGRGGNSGKGGNGGKGGTGGGGVGHQPRTPRGL